jgi:hypothetical protein
MDPAEAKAARRAISDVNVKELVPEGTPSPFGVRNRFLCDARKLAKRGYRRKADQLAEKAEAIAPLTAVERQNIEAAYAHYLGS